MPDDFDPQAPFIGSDGLEYDCVADRLLGNPAPCFRNAQIERYRGHDFPAHSVEQFERLHDQFRRDPDYRRPAEPHIEGVAFFEWCERASVAP